MVTLHANKMATHTDAAAGGSATCSTVTKTTKTKTKTYTRAEILRLRDFYTEVYPTNLTPFQRRSFNGRNTRSRTADQRGDTGGDAIGNRSRVSGPRAGVSLTPALLSINWMILNYGLPTATTVLIAV